MYRRYRENVHRNKSAPDTLTHNVVFFSLSPSISRATSELETIDKTLINCSLVQKTALSWLIYANTCDL